jgi:glycosyltransferase involved in cell wall biosynthesis
MNNSNQSNIVIISIYPFPIGMAATNRIIAYSKGLIEAGANVEIVLPFPTDTFSINKIKIKNGNHCKIKFTYTSGVSKSKYRFNRALSLIFQLRKIKGYITSFFYLLKNNRKKKYSHLIVSTDNIPTLWVYSIIAKTLKLRSIFIFDEYPIPIRHKLKKSIPGWKIYIYRLILKNYNAYVSISKELAGYFGKICSKPTHILPIIVDTSRFKGIKNQSFLKSEKKYLCYMGNMELSKDDVDNIIRAFSIISHKYENLKLHLYGAPNQKTKSNLLGLINSLNLVNKVQLMGRVDSDQVPDILQNAYVLLSSQPDTVRASGGFPTKLGEYLSTGIPALLTKVGENAKYVNDGVHVFFSEPDNPKAYSEKLSYILDNYEIAKKIAFKGKSLLSVKYSHILQGEILLEFLEKL